MPPSIADTFSDATAPVAPTDTAAPLFRLPAVILPVFVMAPAPFEAT